MQVVPVVSAPTRMVCWCWCWWNIVVLEWYINLSAALPLALFLFCCSFSAKFKFALRLLFSIFYTMRRNKQYIFPHSLPINRTLDVRHIGRRVSKACWQQQLCLRLSHNFCSSFSLSADFSLIPLDGVYKKNIHTSLMSYLDSWAVKTSWSWTVDWKSRAGRHDMNLTYVISKHTHAHEWWTRHYIRL